MTWSKWRFPNNCSGNRPYKNSYMFAITQELIQTSMDLYKKCLRLFPETHRREYGRLMSQLFHDQLREIQRQNHPFRFIRLWVRALADVAINSACEHVYERRQYLMETKNKLEFLVKYHVAELVCGVVALVVSFLSFRFGWVAFFITTASATVIGTVIATILDKRWRASI